MALDFNGKEIKNGDYLFDPNNIKDRARVMGINADDGSLIVHITNNVGRLS